MDESEPTKARLAASAKDAVDGKAIDLSAVDEMGTAHTLGGPDHDSGVGVGVAVGVNVADVTNRAYVAGASS